MKMLRASLGLLVATLLLPVAPVNAITINITPPTQFIGVGGTASVEITVSGLNAASEIVSGFDIDLLFNPAILSPSSVSSDLAAFGGAANADSGFNFLAGLVAIQLVSFLADAALDALQGDSVLLATVSFQGLADGFGNLSFGLDPNLGRNVVGRNAVSLQLTADTACIAVGTGTCQQVPEPATWGLWVAALIALGIFRSRSAGMSMTA